jgi:hypothetical protein
MSLQIFLEFCIAIYLVVIVIELLLRHQWLRFCHCNNH